MRHLDDVGTARTTQCTTGSGPGPGSPSGSGSSSSATRRCPACWGWPCAATPSGPICWCRTCWASTCPQSPVGGVRPRRRARPRVRELLGAEQAGRAVVLGYAETATGLGHCVADGVGLAPYLHSTRRPVDGRRPGGRLRGVPLPRHLPSAAPGGPGPAGRGPARWSWSTTSSPPATPCSTPSATCTRAYPRERYVVVALVDMRSAADAGRLDDVRATRSARASTWWRGLGHGAAARGRPGEGPGRWSRGTRAAEAATATARAAEPARRRRPSHRVDLRWPARPPRRRPARLHPGAPRPPGGARSPPWPPASPTPCPTTRAASSSSASRS